MTQEKVANSVSHTKDSGLIQDVHSSTVTTIIAGISTIATVATVNSVATGAIKAHMYFFANQQLK